MPNRIIRDGILSSERVDAIAGNPACEVFYRRLFSVADDFGRFCGDPRMIRAALYPLRLDSMSESVVREYLAACESAGLLITYSIDGKPYLELSDFRQRLRRMISKYPAPLLTVNRQSSDSEVPLESEDETEVETETCASGDARVFDSPSPLKKAFPYREASTVQQAWFATWWQSFWLKKDRLRALDAFIRHVRSQEQFDQVMAATRQQSPEMLAKEPKHRPYGASWLERERFLDEAVSHEEIHIPGWDEGKDLR